VDPKYADCVAAARELVDQEFVTRLKTPRPATVAIATVLIWLQMVGIWALALFGPFWLLWLPFLSVCALTQGMLLWMHEASHFSFCRDRLANDIWCDIFFAGPIGVSVAAYRARHMTHHAHLGTENDEDGYPYRVTVKGFGALMMVVIRALTGSMGIWLAKDKYLSSASRKITATSGSSPRWVAPTVTLIFNFSLLALCVWSGRWYVFFLLWVYPIVAVSILLNIIRTIAEHQPEDFSRYIDESESTMRPVIRTTVPNWFEKWMMYQANFNYHLEHHMFPAIPQHNLRKVHLRLLEGGFYRRFPETLQRSGFIKFWRLARNAEYEDFSEALKDVVPPR
jgi:fatty acid desaturase